MFYCGNDFLKKGVLIQLLDKELIVFISESKKIISFITLFWFACGAGGIRFYNTETQSLFLM